MEILIEMVQIIARVSGLIECTCCNLMLTTQIEETIMSTNRIKCWVSGVVQSNEAGRMVFVRTRLTEASSFLCFDSSHSAYLEEKNLYTRMSLKSSLCASWCLPSST